MRTPIDLLLRPEGNIENVVWRLLLDEGVRANRSIVAQSLRHHPSYPSMAAVSDILLGFGIDTVAIKTERLETLEISEAHFIVQVKIDNHPFFAIIYGLLDNVLDWYNPVRHQRETISTEKFYGLFTGYVMMMDVSRKKDENHYLQHRRNEYAKQCAEWCIFLLYPLLAASVIILGTITFHTVLFLLYMSGSLLGLLLMLFEHNRHSPIVSHICSVSKQLNCDNIVNSRASHFFGISWAVIGTAYFMGMTIFLSLTYYTNDSVFIASILHFPAICYAIYSVYYQARIAKNWCPLCLSVQIVIISIFSLFIFNDIYASSTAVSLHTLLLSFVSFILSFTIVYLLMQLSRETKIQTHYENGFKQLKYDRQVFTVLLNKGRKIVEPEDNLGIVLGNPQGNTHIIKVCHPYCSHCADANPILQRIANNDKEVRLQVIFFVNPDEKNYEKLPVDHFLSLQVEGADMEEVLNDWYAASPKDVKMFKNKHPVKGIHPENRSKAMKMLEFCKVTNIVGTPTVFINGYELKYYQIKELLYI